jgi:hypothetical protein
VSVRELGMPMGTHRRGAAQGIDVESTERRIKISGMPRVVFCLVIFFCCQIATAAADKILGSVDAASSKEIVASSQDALSGRRGVTVRHITSSFSSTSSLSPSSLCSLRTSKQHTAKGFGAVCCVCRQGLTHYYSCRHSD